MPVLYVTEARATLRRRGGSLIVTVDKDPDAQGPLPEKRVELIEVEPHRLEAIALFEGAHITSDAVYLCLEHGITVNWIKWNGEYLGALYPHDPKNADLKIMQYSEYLDPNQRLNRAKAVLDAKLSNAVEVLEDIRNNSENKQAFSDACAELRELRKSLEKQDSSDSLLGVEGASARIYFGALRRGFKVDAGFRGRQRRPPPDPANSLLSFAYVLLGKRLETAIRIRGLEPDIGFFHVMRPGRPSLMLDLLEEFRHPVVDRFVIRTFNLKILGRDDFEDKGDDGFRLTRHGMKTFFLEWEKHLLKPLDEKRGVRISPRDLIQRQVDRFASALRNGERYKAFEFGD